MHWQAVMFDLDGTLADTLDDLAEAGNHMRTTFGRDPLPRDPYRTLVGQGRRYLAQHALELPEDDPRIDEAAECFRDYLLGRDHPHTRPYPGIAAMLDGLTERGLTLTVLSNKPDDSTVTLVEREFAAWPFAHVRGHREGWPPKPDVSAAMQIVNETGIAADRWVYVGDTRVDMLTGTGAGMFTVGVTWGFRDEAELRDGGAHAIIHEPGELLRVMEDRAGLVT